MGQGVKTRKLNYTLMMPQEYWDQGRHYLQEENPQAM